MKYSGRGVSLLLAVALLFISGCSNSVSKDVGSAPGPDINTLIDTESERPSEAKEVRMSEPVETKAAMPVEGLPTTVVVTPNFVSVKVFYATDRGMTSDKAPSGIYGTERSGMTYGTCDVSIPRDHRMGNLESPKIYKFEFKADPEKHVVLLGVSKMDKDVFFTALKDKIARSQRKSAFIFVHGYNTTFADAARRTAQMSYDLGFDGAPVFFSWPSKEALLAYSVDETNIEWAQPDLRRFLSEFAAEIGAENIYLIAHSMGNRGITKAFASLAAETPALTGKIREVILTAPDIDAGVFMNEIVPKITGFSSGVTLYSSSTDEALMLSKKYHGYPRAGDAGEGLIVAPGIDTIDATEVDTSLLGHSYFAENRSVLSDIYYLINDGKRAASRFSLGEKQIPAGKYWVFKK